MSEIDQYLCDAAYEGDIETVQGLLHRGVSPNVRDRDGETPLLLAATMCHAQVIDALIEAGADVNARNPVGTTVLARVIMTIGDPMQMAAKENLSEENRRNIVEALLKAGANPNAVGVNAFTPLHDAAYKNLVSILKLLVESGANLNAKGAVGLIEGRKDLTPLDVARACGNTSAVSFLMRAV